MDNGNGARGDWKWIRGWGTCHKRLYEVRKVGHILNMFKTSLEANIDDIKWVRKLLGFIRYGSLYCTGFLFLD